MHSGPDAGQPAIHSGTHSEFYDYYARESLRPETRSRFARQKDALLCLLGADRAQPLAVADIGCGAGTSAFVWAAAGHRVVGVDVNRPLVALAAARAEAESLPVRFVVASAHALPLPESAFDVCLAPELLEHVPAWESCVAEAWRILRPGGIAFFSTTNALCPAQQEFNLPLFGWYPPPLKRHYIEQARTSRPELANYATYPAVNWFTFYSLRRALRARGFDRCWDRFDMARQCAGPGRKRAVLNLIRGSAALRLAGYVATPGTQIVARKAHG